MIVLLTGMGRSGSTWAFNVAKALLSRTSLTGGEYNNDIGAAIAQLDPRIEHYLVKAHMVDRLGHMMIRHNMCRTICTWREPLECIASSMEAFGSAFEATVAMAKGWLAFLELQSRERSVLFVSHEDIVARPDAVIRTIAGYLDTAVDDAEVERVGGLFSKSNVARFANGLARTGDNPGVGANGWDRDTLLYPGHIRAAPSAPDQLLSADQLAHAIAALQPLVDARGQLAGDIKQRLTRAAA